MFDTIDQKILTMLQDDARVSTAEIARSLDMASSGIHERIKKLEERGVLKGYMALVDPLALELGLLAYLYVRTGDPVGGDTTAQILASRPEIQEVHHVAGEDCYLVKVRVKDTAALSHLLKEIGTIPHVRSTRTTIVLETTKETLHLPITQTPGEGDRPAAPRPLRPPRAPHAIAGQSPSPASGHKHKKESR